MKLLFITCILLFASCEFLTVPKPPETDSTIITAVADTIKDDTNAVHINTGNTQPEQIVNYAETLIGIPYKYASINPDSGFDCSGFITYVFNHFNITVPRSSVDFTNVFHATDSTTAKPGDLILFTGTDSTTHIVGHMGIVIKNDRLDTLRFIHSTSGKADGVTITPLNDYYKSRFVKIVRVFPQNDKQ